MSEPPEEEQQWRGLPGNIAMVAAAYSLLSVLMTYPLVTRFAGAIPAGSGDVWQNLWNYWWWHKALLELGVTPLRTGWLFAPGGVDLLFHTHSPFNMLVALPVVAMWGPSAGYNFSVLLALTLSGLGAWLLARELGASPAGAFLAGLVFSYFPQHMEQLLEHVNLFSVQFLPFTLVYFLRLGREGGWRNAICLGAAFAANALCSWHLGLMLCLVLAPAGLWMLWRTSRPRMRVSLELAVAAALAALAVAPVLGPMIAEIAAGADYYLKPQSQRGIDWAYLLTPQYAHPVFGALVRGAYVDRAYQAAGFVCFLGITPVLLAMWGALGNFSKAWPWALLALAGLLLAPGAHPLWNGHLLEGVTLPHAALEHLPLFKTLRVANRFHIYTSLGLAMLAAWGATRLPRPAWAWAACGLVLFEYLWLPFPIRSTAVSPYYQELAADPGAGIVLDIPFNQRNRTVLNMTAQTVHGKPIVAGYVSAFPPEALARIQAEPALRVLSDVPAADAIVDLPRLRELGIGAIVFHKYRWDSVRAQRVAEADRDGGILLRKEAQRAGGIPDATAHALMRQIEDAVGPPAWEDDEIIVYRLGDVTL